MGAFGHCNQLADGFFVANGIELFHLPRMKWMRFTIALSSLLLAATYTTHVAACSMASGYKVPTTLELVAAADAIVLARVYGEIEGSGDSEMGEVQLSPEKLLYGSELPKAGLTLRGYLQTHDMIATNSDPDELEQANPDAFWGFCNRYVFRKDMLLLLFPPEAEGW